MDLANIDTKDPHATVRIKHGGETRWARKENWQAVADDMIAKHGPGIPDVLDTCDKTSAVAAPDFDILPRAKSETKAIDAIPGGSFDAIGEGRSRIDLAAAEGAGFAPAATVYRRGLRVNDLGVANATRSRMEHDALPLVGAAMSDFREAIVAEGRHDMTVDTYRTRMTASGALAFDAVIRPALLTGPAFQSLLGYHSHVGGSSYLAKCWPELRAINYNRWMDALGNEELGRRNQLSGKALASWRPAEMKLRLRKSRVAGREEVFGVVSPTYAAFDVDKVAEAVSMSMPSDAKAVVTYDGHKTIIDVQFHSNVQPKHYVAGEFFKAGIRIKTDDHGGSSIVGSAIVFQNLCLNLIVIDECTHPLFRIRHVGSVRELARRLRDGMKSGLAKLDHFLKAWDYACEKPLLEDVAYGAEERPMSIEQALPGIFNGIIERELVPVRGNRTDAIVGLRRMAAEDTSYAAQGIGGSRAMIVNAFTRYAHRIEQDEFASDEIERNVSRLLYGRKQGSPEPLPYIPV